MLPVRVVSPIVAVDFTWRSIVSFVAGLVMLGLSVWLFASGPGVRLRRSFALLLLITSIGRILLPFSEYQNLPYRWKEYADIARPAAIVFFAWTFFDHYRRGEPGPLRRAVGIGLPVVLLLATAWIGVLYLQDHSRFYWYDRATEEGKFGWIAVVSALQYPLMVLPAFLFLQQWGRAGAQTSAWHRIALAFLLTATFFPVSMVVSQMLPYLPGRTPFVQMPPGDPIVIVQRLMLFLAALLSVLVVVQAHLIARRIGTPNAKKQARLLLAAWLVVVASAVVSRIILNFRLGEYFDWPHFVFVGIWSLALPVLALGPVLHERLLDVEQAVRHTIRLGTVVSILVAVAFVSVEVLANFLSDRISLAVGMGAAAVLLLALHPLQRFADRLSKETVPAGRPVAEMTQPERLRIYREQAELAWMDGNLQRKERLLLDRLRERLGLSLSEAAELERQAIG